MSKVIFICTGNTCRSPMAEGFFNLLVRRTKKEHYALSCGLSASASLPASQNAIAAAAEYGADIAEHRSRRATKALLAGAEAVYCMTAAHAAMLKAQYPEYGGIIKVIPCGEVPDPYGGSLAQYIETAGIIYGGVEEIVKGLP